MRRLSKKPTVNKFIKTFLLNKDFTIYTNDKLIFSYSLNMIRQDK